MLVTKCLIQFYKLPQEGARFVFRKVKYQLVPLSHPYATLHPPEKTVLFFS